MIKSHKEIEIGDILFFVDTRNFKVGFNNQYVNWGVVVDKFSSECRLELYEPFETRTIDGVPIKDVKTPTRWKKLPKGWDCDTRLFELGHINIDDVIPNITELLKQLRVDDVQTYKKLIEVGYFVKSKTIDRCGFYEDIDKSKGWRVVRTYNSTDHHPNTKSIPYHQLFKTYQEANQKISDYTKELERQANLSDLEWSIEQIDKTIDRWAVLYSKQQKEKDDIRERLLALDDVEDIETRIYGSCVEWKYWKNKKWITIEPSAQAYL